MLPIVGMTVFFLIREVQEGEEGGKRGGGWRREEDRQGREEEGEGVEGGRKYKKSSFVCVCYYMFY